MKFVKILILCICFMYAEAFHNFRASERKTHKYNHIDDLKLRLMSDKRYTRKPQKTTEMATAAALPPYVRKHNKRFKALYESMHKNPFEEEERMRQYERNFRLEKRKHHGSGNINNNNNNGVFGYFEKYKTIDDQYRANEIPENDVLGEVIHKLPSARKGEQQYRKHKHSHNHHHHNHHHHHHSKIKKIRTRPEAGIMQKKLKIK